MKTRTTKVDYDLFVKTVKKWIKYLGLVDWEVYFEHSKDNQFDGLGWCRVAVDCDNLPNRSAVIGLETDWGANEVTASEVKRVAFHESCELLFARIEALAADRFIQRRELREEVHALIRRLESSVFRDVRP